MQCNPVQANEESLERNVGKRLKAVESRSPLRSMRELEDPDQTVAYKVWMTDSGPMVS